MSPLFPEQAIDSDCAPLSRGRRDFAGVCGRLHFFLLPAAPLPPGVKKIAAPQEKKCPPAEY